MSMTVEEAKEILDNIWDFAMAEDDDKGDVLEGAVNVAISALEEVQQYREYREIFESHFTEDALKLFSDKEEFSKWFERGKWHVLKCDELGREVEKYRAIGTVSEFRENKNFLEFLYNTVLPNEMEQYLSMYHASEEKGEYLHE